MPVRRRARHLGRADVAGGAVVGLPIAPAADLLIGTTSAASAAGGDVWPTSLAFTGPLPIVPAGQPLRALKVL